MTIFRTLAGAVVLLHIGFILLVATGALLLRRWPRLVWVHLPALAWGVGTLTIGFPCPLTSAEKTLRRWAGVDVYEGGFVDQYIEGVVYPEGYSSTLRAVVALIAVAGYVRLLGRRDGSVVAARP